MLKSLPEHRLKALLALLIVASGAASASCSASSAAAPDSNDQQGGAFCAGVGFPGVTVEVRDLAGRPIAGDAVATVRDGRYVSTVIGTGSLSIGLADNRAGTYDVMVSKLFYGATTVSGVVVPGGPCGATQTVFVPVRLALSANAPAIRSVTVIPSGAGLGWAGLTLQYSTIVDAAAGADTTIRWTLSDSAAATITASGLLTSKCVAASRDLNVTATSRLDPTKHGSGRLTITVDPAHCP